MNRALFLDRDGVINVEKDYLYKIEDFEFIDGIFELCRYYQKQGFIIVVVTNQSGIVRDYYTEEDFAILTSWMLEEFSSKDIDIKKVYYCPHHPDISGECRCRKPNPGMLLQAAEELNIDLKNSIIIGDKERDVLAGINAGLTTTYLFDESNRIKVSKANKIVSKLEDIYSVNT
ncbi:D-glycero-beta-D-manno-heptose 1,7-bisphosphate 7-phosphatase [Sulfurimonas sp.]|uniref:D-glycero-beta-D-manno-heptose 1,7-bisphosphate 7-phosphatase n=1 Tax=Sulfurimonas sp. TaxID=2022749 RepID=UPI003565779C